MADSLNRHFLLRKFHSLLGLLPVGLFLMFHLTVNFSATGGKATYNGMVASIHKMPESLLITLEIVVIMLPLLIHALYGLVIWWQSQNVLVGNAVKYGWAKNWLYVLQRITGGLTFIFIAVHLGTTRYITLMHPEKVHDLFTMMQARLADPWMFWLYVVGIAASTFHLANGLRLMGITWGLTIGPRSQRFAIVFATIVFFVLMGIGMQGLLAFV